MDVTPPTYQTQGLTGASGGFEVGNEIFGYVRCGRGTCPITHAFLWIGSSVNTVDLTPLSHVAAHVSAIQNGVEVGWVQLSRYIFHAALWRGSAASFVDLNNPADCCGSQLYGIDGNVQVDASLDANDG